jgi:hypothetical protein
MIMMIAPKKKMRVSTTVVLMIISLHGAAAIRAVLQDNSASFESDTADRSDQFGASPDATGGGNKEQPATKEISAVKEELRSLSPFEFVRSCVPINVLVLAQSNEGRNTPDAVEGEMMSPFGAFISGIPAALDAIKTEVKDMTLFVSFVDADFITDEPVKVVRQRSWTFMC